MRFSTHALLPATLAAAALAARLDAGADGAGDRQPGFVAVLPVRSFFDRRQGRLGSTIQSLLPAGHAYNQPGESAVNWAHESTHAVNSRVQGALVRETKQNGWAAMLVQGPKSKVESPQLATLDFRLATFICRQPRLRLRDVAAAVPTDERGPVYGLYLLRQQSQWDECPLYVLDEWSAYLNGTTVGLEIGRPEAASLEQALEFQFYAAALLRAIARLDPNYSDRDALSAFVAGQVLRAGELLAEARRQGVASPRAETIDRLFQERHVK
jgi:hypothetical protein